jgi:hypothetical protein
MSNTGAVRARESRSMSGVAMEVEFNLLAARVAEKGDQMELLEEGIWRLFAEYQGMPYDCVINYPESYNVRDEHRDLEFLMKASATPVQDPEYRKALEKQIVDTVINDKEAAESIKTRIDAQATVEPHYMTNPQTGDTVYITDASSHEAALEAGYLE